MMIYRRCGGIEGSDIILMCIDEWRQECRGSGSLLAMCHVGISCTLINILYYINFKLQQQSNNLESSVRMICILSSE
jgi:hypothetical protein